MKQYTFYEWIPADIAVPIENEFVLCLLDSERTERTVDWYEMFFMGYYDGIQWYRVRNHKPVEVQCWVPLDVLPPMPEKDRRFVFCAYQRARKLKESKE